MIRKIALLATAGVLAASVASAQTPPPGNVNPGSTKSGAEQTGAPNQPRSQNGGMQNGGAMKGTTGAAPRMQDGMSGPATRDGTNATVKPGSQESGSEPAGEPAPQRR